MLSAMLLPEPDRPLTTTGLMCPCLRLLPCGRLAALTGRRQSERFAVFRHGASRNLDSLRCEQRRELRVGERSGPILIRDESADTRANRDRWAVATVGTRHVAREEVPELEDAAGRVHVFPGRDTRDGRLVHADGLRDAPGGPRLPAPAA